MINYNLALEIDQEQRLAADWVSIEQQADEEGDLFIQGGTHAAFEVDPKYPESQAYWEGYQQELRKTWIQKKTAHRPCENGIKAQGYLLTGYSALKAKYGKIRAIDTELDYQGWVVELNGLYVEIATLDWGGARNETKWTVYSTHPDVLDMLRQEFDPEFVIDINLHTA